MLPPHRSILPLVVFLLIFINASAAKRKTHTCPIGFSLAFNKYKDDDPFCYRRKGPEDFNDKFKDCAGNLYTSKLYHSLNFTEPNLVLWTDYKSLYPGGPFIDWSYSQSTGDILVTTYDVNYDPQLGLDDNLCVVIDPVTNFTATRCNEKHYRYCFVKPFENEEDASRDGCKDLSAYNYWRFWSPRPTCLTVVTPAGGGAVRATWRQAQELCLKRRGSLLSSGWSYASDPIFSSDIAENFPLGIVLSPDNTSIKYASDNVTIPTSDWHFESSNVSSNTSLGALRDDFWFLVNSSFVFFNVICERPIQLRPVSMDVSVDEEGKLVLKTNETIDEKYIYCFTDSVIYFPTQIKVKYDSDSNLYVLKPIADGYYWCVNVDSRNHTVSESNRALFIREKQSLINYYAIKIRLKTEYKFDNLEQFYREWEKGLEEYIFYRTKYIEANYDDALNDPETSEYILKRFKETHPRLKFREKDMIYKIKLKKLYLDGRTALVHVLLNPEMQPVLPGTWDDLTVEFMKPIYFCRGFSSVPMMPIGSSISVNCETHTCVGEFNEGVQWVTKATDGCTTTLKITSMKYPINVEMNSGVDLVMPTPETVIASTQSDKLEETTVAPEAISTEYPKMTEACGDSISSDSCEEELKLSTETTTAIEVTIFPETVSTVTFSTSTGESVSTSGPVFPVGNTTTTTTTTTRPPPPPDEQLQQVMDDLEELLKNETVPVLVADIEPAFDQVDSLLNTEEDLAIPGNLLHLLDQIGKRIFLNGSHQAQTVRDNFAMLLADAEPEAPVRGLRIAARDDDMFTSDAFEIISEELNSTHLISNKSEAVVHLPDSVANSSRRISFVVFRNDRAFQANHSRNRYSVNSRVLSINIENITEFEDGEVIDIHLSPLLEVTERNQSRSCAYWHFIEDGTGYWSQEGCTFIKSQEEGVLDTCRCVHLTHFAEVLVPRAVFSQRNEDILEILSILGCCLSIFGLIMIGLTAAMFRSWRRDYSNKIWLQLCVAIFMLVICFLVIVFAKFDLYTIPCMLVGVLLHYSVLASFCWMLVAAILSYRRLVIVFTRDASHKLLRASAFSWGVPCAIVGILLSVAPHSYAGRFEEKTPSGAFCYPSGLGLWLAVYAPIAVMLVANWTLFVLIVRSVFASRRIQRHGDSNEALRCASVSCLLVFLFGLPWVFGLFAYNIVAAYFFNILATFQGFVLFLFFVLGNKKTRDLWLNKLKIKQTRKVPVTSSTYTNRSTGSGYRGQGAASIEANSTKPKSLSSPDNSRFS